MVVMLPCTFKKKRLFFKEKTKAIQDLKHSLKSFLASRWNILQAKSCLFFPSLHFHQYKFLFYMTQKLTGVMPLTDTITIPNPFHPIQMMKKSVSFYTAEYYE
uniref:Uncharacterized protein n=1 Tax=Micrurus spixii TaxID=129469 RepID=A0A2D4LGJ3_9SAUR